MPDRDVPLRPADEPLRYAVGGWPDGEIRALKESEGGDRVHYQLEQLRLFVSEVVATRTARGVTQSSLAELTGLRRNTISELESGRSYPDWTTISRIAHALDADIRFIERASRRVDDPSPR